MKRERKPLIGINRIAWAAKFINRIEEISGVSGIRGGGRFRKISDIRCMAITHLSNECNLSMRRTAILCGLINHSSVYHAKLKFETLIEVDKPFRQLAELIGKDERIKDLESRIKA